MFSIVKKNLIKYIGIITLLISYILLILNFILNGFNLELNGLLIVIWVFGVLNVVFNSFYAILINLDETTFSVFGTCGLIWFVPFFIDVNQLIGLPSLLIYLIIAVRMFLKK